MFAVSPSGRSLRNRGSPLAISSNDFMPIPVEAMKGRGQVFLKDHLFVTEDDITFRLSWNHNFQHHLVTECSLPFETLCALFCTHMLF